MTFSYESNAAAGTSLSLASNGRQLRFNQLAQGCRTWIPVQVNEELFESLDLCYRIGVNNIFLDAVRDERHRATRMRDDRSKAPSRPHRPG